MWLLGTAVCVHLLDKYCHVTDEMRCAEDIMWDNNVPPIRKSKSTGRGNTKVDHLRTEDGRRGRVLSTKRRVHGQGEALAFESVYDGTRYWKSWREEEKIPVCRVEVGDVVLVEVRIRRTRPAPASAGVEFELGRVAQVFAGPGVIWEQA